MPKIEFLDVTKKYGRITAVENLNFTIHDGEYLSLLGPSGCGKTTTLRMMSGLVLPTSGEILWDGEPVQDLPPDERDIGYVFQQFAIFPNMNIWENIAYPLEVRGYDRDHVQEQVGKYLDLVGLTTKAHLFPRDVGAAELQRTGISRVLARGAKMLLLDEPFGALDFKVREQFQDELRGIVKKLDLTAIHVTHDQSEGIAISDRIGVMKKGRMIQLATPVELLIRPSQIFSAHFLGESNFLEGIVSEKRNSLLTVELIGGRKLTVSSRDRSYSVGNRVVLGFRKAFATIVDDAGENCLKGKVISDRYLGEKRRVVAELAYGRSVEVLTLPHERVREVGDVINIEILPHNLLIFKFPRNGLEDALEVT